MGSYDAAEIGELFAAFRGTKLELAVMFGAFYGLRRSEIVGLKWSAIDFTANTLTIRHTVTSCTLDGKQVTIAKDRTKTKSSMRTLPLVPQFREYLLALKEKQENYRKLCGNSYSKKYLEYIYVDELGERMSPNYITAAFPQMLEKFGLRKIRFHDTRHSCASLLLANGVPMKQIQEWLGHGGHENTQLTKLLDLRRLNKFSRGAICKEFWNSFLMGRFARTSGQEFRPRNTKLQER